MISVRSLLSETHLPKNEARILLAHLLNVHLQLPKSALFTHDDSELSTHFVNEWRALELRRSQGEPIAYLIGKRAFHAIDLQVAPGVLIPRPETELLVELALTELRSVQTAAQTSESSRVLDLGTGSGAIALAVAHANPGVHCFATDTSSLALDIAKQNAIQLQLPDRVSFYLGNWYAALGSPSDFQRFFDIILSNPPYIQANDPHLSQGDLRFEPESALTDYATGLTCLQLIIDRAPNYLRPGGLIAVEHGFDQSDAVLGLMASAGFAEITPHQDLAGHWRAVSARKPL